MCKQFLLENGRLVHNLRRNHLDEKAAGVAGNDQTPSDGKPGGSRRRHPRLRAGPPAQTRAEADRREPGRVPPHPVALLGTGPQEARRARRRPGLRGPERPGDRGGHAGDHHRPGGIASRPGPAPPAPEPGGRAAAAVRRAPGHRGRAGPLRAGSGVHAARTAGQAGRTGPGGLRVPPPWASWGPAPNAGTFPRRKVSPPPAPPPRAASTC